MPDSDRRYPSLILFLIQHCWHALRHLSLHYAVMHFLFLAFLCVPIYFTVWRAAGVSWYACRPYRQLWCILRDSQKNLEAGTQWYLTLFDSPLRPQWSLKLPHCRSVAVVCTVTRCRRGQSLDCSAHREWGFACAWVVQVFIVWFIIWNTNLSGDQKFLSAAK